MLAMVFRTFTMVLWRPQKVLLIVTMVLWTSTMAFDAFLNGSMVFRMFTMDFRISALSLIFKLVLVAFHNGFVDFHDGFYKCSQWL